jgi:hypothetical protein
LAGRPGNALRLSGEQSLAKTKVTLGNMSAAMLRTVGGRTFAASFLLT